jgi:hypothetical protein
MIPPLVYHRGCVITIAHLRRVCSERHQETAGTGSRIMGDGSHDVFIPARVMQKPRVGSHPALDDRRDARQCECATADMEWIGDKRAEER